MEEILTKKGPLSMGHTSDRPGETGGKYRPVPLNESKSCPSPLDSEGAHDEEGFDWGTQKLPGSYHCATRFEPSQNEHGIEY